MPDVYANIAALDAAMQERLADVLETRGADRQQQELRRTFLADIQFPARARVLETVPAPRQRASVATMKLVH